MMGRFLQGILCAGLFLVAAARGGADAPSQVPLSALGLTMMSAGWGRPKVDKSIVGKPMSIAGRKFAWGVGTHAESAFRLQLDGQTERFQAFVGVDDETAGKGTVRFLVLADAKKVFDSGVMKGRDPAKRVDIDLRGVKALLLIVSCVDANTGYDHADWAEAEFVVAGAAPVAVDVPAEPKEILTPKPGPAPRLHGPKVYGCRPGHLFLYRVPCTGERPIEFAADNLPASLKLDASTGIIAGRAPEAKGAYAVALKASNARGGDEREFKIVVGPTLALTPPMGWNDWYTHYNTITDKIMRGAADAMVSSGMADFGYQYVNIDDCWMTMPGSKDPLLGGEPRGPDGAIRPNGRFPDMKALADYIHAKGLKAGLYTSPGPLTCGKYEGSYEHEEIDARQFAQWGFDFLKYDWCSYGKVAEAVSLADRQKPYRKMSAALRAQDRDIVFNLCQYGAAGVWTWGAEVGGNCWRTTGDLGPRMRGGLPGFYVFGLSNAEHAEWAGPGGWNDPDYILIGVARVPRRKDTAPRPVALTGNEQYSYMSLWCMMAAPLIYSGDMTQLDDFTLNVLCNAEVIDVDQDALGWQGRIARRTDDEVLMIKPLEDGSMAIGLFNLAESERRITATWAEMGLQGAQRLRDLWRQKDLGTFEGEYSATVPRHGVMLARLQPVAGQ